MDSNDSKSTIEDSGKNVNVKISQSQSKKIVKHALRQQAKRRRKNTTIAAGTSAPLPSYPRVVVKTFSVPSSTKTKEPEVPAPEVVPPRRPLTSKEVLASIPGFVIKQRKRTAKKMSFAEQLKQMREGYVDLETPDSILCNVDIKSVVNNQTFAMLPPLFQQKLLQLLPEVDRASATILPDGSVQLSSSTLNNEFFARACEEWRDRLAKGEFTPENQQRLKAEREKDRLRLDPWKLKNFEPIWGYKEEKEPSPPRPPIKTTIKLRSSSSLSAKKPQAIRTVGAVTRAITNYRQKSKSKRTASNKRESKSVKKLKLSESTESKNPDESEHEDNVKTEEDVCVEVEDEKPVEVETVLTEIVPEFVVTEADEIESTLTQKAEVEEEEILDNQPFVETSAENSSVAEEELPKEEAVVVEEVLAVSLAEESVSQTYDTPVSEAENVIGSSYGREEVIKAEEEEIMDQEMKQEESSRVEDFPKMEETVVHALEEPAVVNAEVNIIAGKVVQEDFKVEVEDISILADQENTIMESENYILQESTLVEASQVMEDLGIETKSSNDTERSDLLEIRVPEASTCWDVDSTENLLEADTDEGLRLDWRYDAKVDSSKVVMSSSAPGKPCPVQLLQDFSKLSMDLPVASDSVSKSDSMVSSTVNPPQASAFVEPHPVTSSAPVSTTLVCLPPIVSPSTLVSSPTPSTSAHSASNIQKVTAGAVPHVPVNTAPVRSVKSGGKEKGNRNSRAAANKPPPGAVNLERSYQICQAVIQSSPNRDQLKAQLKPPPSMLASAVSGSAAKKGEASKKEARMAATQYSAVTSSKNGIGKTFTPTLPGNSGSLMKSMPAKVNQLRPALRQPSSPVMVRHVFTSSQGIPVTMAVLPHSQGSVFPEVLDHQTPHVGQYILVQRTGLGDPQQVYSGLKGTPPRASSAPPSNINQVHGHASGRDRPASVDGQRSGSLLVQCPNPGVQAVTRRAPRLAGGLICNEMTEMDQPPTSGSYPSLNKEPVSGTESYTATNPWLTHRTVLGTSVTPSQEPFSRLFSAIVGRSDNLGIMITDKLNPTRV